MAVSPVVKPSAARELKLVTAPTSVKDKIAELRVKKKEIEQGGGQLRLQKQHESGKLGARERLQGLVDQGSFQEVGLFTKHRATYFGMSGKELAADGVITGCATIDGRLVHVASQDFTVAGGAAGEAHCTKIVEMMQLSLKTGSPFVFINDSGGARVQEGIDSLAGYAPYRRYRSSAARAPAEPPTAPP